MDKKVIISINGLQIIDGEEDVPVEVISPGEYRFEDGCHVLTFDQTLDEFEEPIHTMIKLTESTMEIIKTGSVENQMFMEKGKRTISVYSTPLGSMDVGVFATNVIFKEEEESLESTAEYALDVNGMFIGDCTVSVKARSADSGITL